MSQERDECEGVVVGSMFWVISRYKMESQGVFERSTKSHQLGTGEWKRVEGVWNQVRAGVLSRVLGWEKKGGCFLGPSVSLWSGWGRVGSRWLNGPWFVGRVIKVGRKSSFQWKGKL
ncbi:hypothetical protein Pint_36315 [Pistacia integerrima]|uniref:Uncharacterized protein n=1 Tax=Pistacia integerrima TaxID=434235 RepID=A0ACC0XZV6_9ROSI|nr:hypothetical protein Pint_36315 [Pistacia integerrima]